MYKGLLELIKLIFGPKALSKTIGTRTNVIKLPNNKTKRYTKQDLDIESASDAAAMNAKKEMEELVAEIPKMNDAERLIFEGNLRRLKNRLGIRSEKDPTADVYEFGTKLKATPKGIETLTEQAGQKSPPGTLMGDLESRLNKLRASGKELEDIAKEKGGVKFSIPEEGIFNEELSADNLFDTIIKQQERFRKMQNSGLVTSTAREILQRDIKAGKLKLPKEIEDRIMLVDGNPGTVNPVEVFRTNYGEDALEQIDSLIPELANAQSYSDLVKIVEKKYPMKPLAKPRKETMTLDEATKAEEENILTPGKAIPADSPEGKKITEGLIGKPKAEVVSLPTAEKILSDMRKLGPIDAMKEANKVLKREGPYKNLTDKDIEKIMDDINDHIFGGDLPVDPEDFANGGRVGYMGGGSTGLDYLMGIDRTNYQSGGMTLEQLQAKAPPGEFLAYINPEEAGVLKALGGSGKKINGIPSFFASSPGDTGGAGGADGAGGNDAGGGGSGDTGDMGSEAANVASTTAGAASVGVGMGGPTDPGVYSGTRLGNFARNVANMAKANPISSMIASALLGPIGSLALNTARAYGSTGTTGTVSTNESDGTGNALVQQAIADPLGLNAAARDMSGVDALYNQYRTNVGFQSGGRVNFNEGTLDPAKQKQVKQMIKMGADVDTISTITGATPEQIQQIQQTPRTKNADGGLNYLLGF